MRLLRIAICALAGALALALAGCSAMRLVDNEVNSLARWSPEPPGSTYRFERLPSQQGLQARGEPAQEQLEAMAQEVLARRGLLHHPEAAVLTVQLSATTVVQPGYSGWPPIVSVGAGTAGSHIGMAFPMMRYEPPLYIREVQFLIRDSRSHAVVYETRARHSGIWSDAQAVLPAMMEAALSSFPNPPQGPRRVNVEIAR
jgi:hypothetical protein